MDFKKKLKTRLYVAIIYIALGAMMIVGVVAVKPSNDFISTFGATLIVAGIARIINYIMVTRDDETVRKKEIIETDERNISIIHKAKSVAFSIYTLLTGTAVIVLSLFGKHETAKWIAYSFCLLVVIYWICYWVYQKKS